MVASSEEVKFYEAQPVRSAVILVGIGWYFYKRIVHEHCAAGCSARKCVGGTMICTVISLAAMAWPGPLSRIMLEPSLTSGVSAHEPSALSYMANIATGVVLILLWTLLLAEPFRLLSKRASLVAAGIAGILISHALREGCGDPRIVRRTAELSKLPEGLDGFRIVQLSDLHIGAVVGRAQIQRVVDMVNSLQPDLVAITGDLLDGFDEPSLIEAAIEPLSLLRSRKGVFYVTGNHEYYYGDDSYRVLGELETMLNGIKV
ncbi:hypothetical protein CYMTET_13645 [Cymbomonas tetramitiformis]|uniref:Calcineurin-like phosphoesterase domain-containing protein n=1 Tax=Cymbomonas tetramitiformis TaxID=36881 RepID=A0AAE0LAP1_9CHLO|nr:hypothetical protein CYMTET_13645 [Cymbomonas tetramitiformis]